ncbi:prepilin-type N-terminal cleavage/methylation domain-containing protein [bacterium]|nr:prepilin-type N-terminal cleavage/methylation domain-containing protein [bacterium]
MNKKGFTIIEVLLTIVILSVGLFGLMILFNNASRGAIESDLEIMASNLAREKLEELISVKADVNGYDSLSCGTTTNTVSLGVSPGPVYAFTQEVTIEDVLSDLETDDEDPNDTGIKRIDVKMSWLQTNELTLSTIVTDYDL